MKAFVDWLNRLVRRTPRTSQLKAFDMKGNLIATQDVMGGDLEAAGVALSQEVDEDCNVQAFDESGNQHASFPLKKAKEKDKEKKGKRSLDERVAKLAATTFEDTAKHNNDIFDRAKYLLERDDSEVQELRAELKAANATILNLTIENMAAKHAVELEAAKQNPDSGALKEVLMNALGEAMKNAPEILAGIGAMLAARNAGKQEPKKTIDEKSPDPVTVVADNPQPLTRAERVRMLLRRTPDSAIDEIVSAIMSNKRVTERVMKAIAPHVEGVEARRLIDEYMGG